MMLKGAARKSLTTLDIELGGRGDVDDEDQSETATAVGTPFDDDAFSVGSDGFEETVITTRRRRVSFYFVYSAVRAVLNPFANSPYTTVAHCQPNSAP